MTGVVRNGRVEIDEPIDLPDGTELLISVKNGKPGDDADPENSPKAIDDWLKWCDSLQPLKITPEEQADTDACLKRINDYDIANTDKGIKDLFQ